MNHNQSHPLFVRLTFVGANPIKIECGKSDDNHKQQQQIIITFAVEIVVMTDKDDKHVACVQLYTFETIELTEWKLPSVRRLEGIAGLCAEEQQHKKWEREE